MGAESLIKTACVRCQAGCGLLVHMKNGEIVRIGGDPASPVSRGKLCAKWAASLEYVRHPERLKYPLRELLGE